ncbi:ABC transporter permease subunit [bacterium]|nr:ABC transporter permease subunit [candidate division CSSED10-310 bacterium]
MRAGQLAVPATVSHILNLPPRETQPFLDLLSGLSAGKFELPVPGGQPESNIEILKAWWGDNRLIYTEISRPARLLMAFTHTRYGIWLKNILTLDFGQSFTYDQPVIDVIISKMPVSIQFGVISFFATYLVCIPLGIAKAVRDGSAFDYGTSILLFLMWSIPGFMLAILLIVFFGGGSFFSLIPIGGLYSDNYFDLGLWEKILDRIHHFIAPLICYMIAEFTTLTLLMKNSIIEEISKDYCRTARAKGLDSRTVVLKHALRNALIPIATGIGGFLGIFFTGSMLLEMIFNLDGMGLLGYTSVLSRDFNVIMGDLVIISLITLFGNILSDFIYTVIDPRIDFV